MKGCGHEGERKENRQKKDGGAAAVVEEIEQKVGVAQKQILHTNAYNEFAQADQQPYMYAEIVLAVPSASF